MDMGEWLGLGSLLIANVGAVYFAINDANRKISRVYERFDEYKEHIEQKVSKEFVRRDLCEMMHDNSNANFSKLETRVEDGFKGVNEKMDSLMRLMVGQNKIPRD